MGVPLVAPPGDVNIGGRHATAANVEVTGSIDELVIIGLQLRIVRRCTWHNHVKLRRKGPRVRKGQQLSRSNEEPGESDVGDSKDQGRDHDDVGIDLGDDPLTIILHLDTYPQ